VEVHGGEIQIHLHFGFLLALHTRNARGEAHAGRLGLIHESITGLNEGSKVPRGTDVII
jgi:hypothetical protein